MVLYSSHWTDGLVPMVPTNRQYTRGNVVEHELLHVAVAILENGRECHLSLSRICRRRLRVRTVSWQGTLQAVTLFAISGHVFDAGDTSRHGDAVRTRLCRGLDAGTVYRRLETCHGHSRRYAVWHDIDCVIGRGDCSRRVEYQHGHQNVLGRILDLCAPDKFHSGLSGFLYDTLDNGGSRRGGQTHPVTPFLDGLGGGSRNHLEISLCVHTRTTRGRSYGYNDPPADLDPAVAGNAEEEFVQEKCLRVVQAE